MLFHIGTREHSKGILKSQINSINNKKGLTLDALHKAKELALEMYDAMKSNDLIKFYECINEGWKVKQNFAKGVTNERINKIGDTAIKNGALALKITGAGGGGHMFIYAEKPKHKSIIRTLKKFDANMVDFKYVEHGAKVFNINNL